mgnify:CR=1 FL=1
MSVKTLLSFFCDHRYTAGDFHHIQHAGYGQCGIAIKGFHRAAGHRAAPDHRVVQIRNVHIDAKLCGAGRFGDRIDAGELFANVLELLQMVSKFVPVHIWESCGNDTVTEKLQ